MPTYSYRCTECGHAFDIQQAFTDATLTECPSCGGALRKIFSPVGITFNGSGFYRTDSRAASGGKGGDKGGAGSDAGAAKKEKSGGETTASTPSKSEGGGTPTPAKSSTPGTSSGTRKAASSNATS